MPSNTVDPPSPAADGEPIYLPLVTVVGRR